MKRCLTAVIAALLLAGCKTEQIRPETEPALDAYRSCWMQGDLECTKNLFTNQAWKKAGPIHEDLYARLKPEGLRWGLSYKTNREFGRTIVVSAYYGSGSLGEQAIPLNGVAGFYLNGDGKIRKYSPDIMATGTYDPAAYVEQWPKVQRAVNVYSLSGLADFGSTSFCLLRNPALREGNPLMAPLFETLGPVGAGVALTIGGHYYGRYVLEGAYWDGKPMGPVSSYGPSALHAGAAAWNLSLCL